MTARTTNRLSQGAVARAYRIAALLMIALSGFLAYRIGVMRDENDELQVRQSRLVAQAAALPDRSDSPYVADRDGAANCEQTGPFKVLDEIARQRQLVIESGSASDLDRRDKPASAVQIHARGSYVALRQVLRDAATRLPCLSLDSIDFHRDKTLDQQLVADAKATFYGGARVNRQGDQPNGQ
jgi:hypothetical protein